MISRGISRMKPASLLVNPENPEILEKILEKSWTPTLWLFENGEETMGVLVCLSSFCSFCLVLLVTLFSSYYRSINRGGVSGTRFMRNSSQGKQRISLILIRSLPPYRRQAFACG